MDAKRKVQALADTAAYVAQAIEKESGHIKIVSHFDADGICAGAIIYKTLEYLSKDFEISFVKQLGKEEIVEIAREKYTMLIFLDVGSGQLALIREHIHVPVVVVDHHPPEECRWDKLFHLNPHHAGIDGANEISGAGVAYVLARSLSAQSKSLIDLAIVGAAGDMQCPKGIFCGVNLLLLEDAEYTGAIRCEKGLKLFGRYTRPVHKAIEYCTEPFIENVSGNESGAVQFLSELGINVVDKKGKWRKLCDLTADEEKKLSTVLVVEYVACGGRADELIGTIYKLKNDYDVMEFSSVLNACGRLEKPLLGVKMCLGACEGSEDVLLEYRRKIAKAVTCARRMRKSFIVTDKVTYVMGGSSIDENVIGTVISILLKRDIKTQVAVGFGCVKGEKWVKVSLRAKSRGVDLGDAAHKVAAQIGCGAYGGGHSGAAGGRIPKGSEMRFVELFDGFL
ncbi:MAG: hypothetical protein DRN71_04930 [Candidatus Nanohalarchaeota archaeon]|nr:MAG: hypothetical protein DRN71_04930 [Candidatus Nanohaloarchaeota archaeon]